MALPHRIYDTDAHFKIDPVTRAIRNGSSGKNALIQYDHNSERFTFQLPRLIDSHPMDQCNRVEVHFINIDSADKTRQSKGVYRVDDLQISPDGDDVVICSWLIAMNATQYAGSLNFLIKFQCEDETGKILYRWHTGIYSGISVSSGIDNGEAIAEDYSDILAEWEARIDAMQYTIDTDLVNIRESANAATAAAAQAQKSAEQASTAANQALQNVLPKITAGQDDGLILIASNGKWVTTDPVPLVETVVNAVIEEALGGDY